MSENYRFYREKTRAQQGRAGRLHRQWLELMQVVGRCEAMWALEDRIERSR
ncbi:MAG TPA: hypothetical protein VLK30_12760 [Candidatus Limnocylindrales bacterium]|nr:hypothetical protein [Candidatus Limnocylindrales bacterium]